MGFKVGFISFAFQERRYVFDNKTQALALVGLYGTTYFLHYYNGGLAILRPNLFQQLEPEEIPWVPTKEEARRRLEESDKKIPEEKIIFCGREIPKSWWGEHQQEPEDGMLSAV